MSRSGISRVSKAQQRGSVPRRRASVCQRSSSGRASVLYSEGCAFDSYRWLVRIHPGDSCLPASRGRAFLFRARSWGEPSRVCLAQLSRRTMRHFLYYWFIAVPKLTRAQAFALFYRFVRFVAGSDEARFKELARKTADDSKEILRELE